MKRLIVLIVAVASAAVALAVSKDLTPEQRARMFRVRKIPLKERIRMDGGLVHEPYTGKVVRVVNAQVRLPKEAVEKMCPAVGDPVGIPVRATSAKPGCSMALAQEALKDKDVGVAIVVVDDAKLPTSLLVAPEGPWAVVNVAAFAAGADAETLKSRFIREFWRATAMVLGAANSTYPDCVLQTVRKPEELDGIKALVACPEHFDKMMDAARAWGITRERKTTYRRACELGWAPPPANDKQRQVAEDVKKGLPPEYLRDEK